MNSLEEKNKSYSFPYLGSTQIFLRYVLAESQISEIKKWKVQSDFISTSDKKSKEALYIITINKCGHIFARRFYISDLNKTMPL